MNDRIYYIRISDDRQDVLRQVEGLKAFSQCKGDAISAQVWDSVQRKQASPVDCLVQWDWGSRDMAEVRPNFQRIVKQIEVQNPRDPRRLKELVVYDFDRFGTGDLTEWFHFQYVFRKHGASIIEASSGKDLTSMEDASLMERFMQGWKSTREQKDTAKRVAEQSGELARKGHWLGGVPNWGYDLGCFDGDKLIWRLHYRDFQDRIQVFPTDDSGHAPEPVPYLGENNYPRKGRNQQYRLIPSIEEGRIQCVRDLFRIVITQVPAVGWREILRQLAALGHRSYQGRGFDKITIQRMLENPVYIGFKTQNKFTKARHKRYNIQTKSVIDVPEHEKGVMRRRSNEEWIIPDMKTHDGLIDENNFNLANELLAKLPKRTYYAPRSEKGWLKPLLVCAGCGRGMVCKTIRGKLHYHCLTSVYRSNRPGDPRFQTNCGFNCVSHDDVEAKINNELDVLKSWIEQTVEDGALKNLEVQIERQRALVIHAASTGHKGYLRQVWTDLDLDQIQGCQLAKLIQVALATETEDAQSFLKAFEEIERLKATFVDQRIDQLEKEYKNLTLMQARQGTADRQVAILEGECRRIEGQLGLLEKHLSPLKEQREKLEREYQELLDRHAEAVSVLKAGESRAKGAALARVFAKIVLSFGRVNEGHKGRGRHGRMISVWLPNLTRFVYHYETIFSDNYAHRNLENALNEVQSVCLRQQTNCSESEAQARRLTQNRPENKGSDLVLTAGH